MTEAEKRQLDAFRMMDKHPATDFSELPEDVRSYISSLTFNLHDLKRERVTSQTILILAVGLGSIFLGYKGWGYDPSLSIGLGILILISPWYFIRREREKIEEQYGLPSYEGECPHPIDEGIRHEWELEFIVKNRQDQRREKGGN